MRCCTIKVCQYDQYYKCAKYYNNVNTKKYYNNLYNIKYLLVLATLRDALLMLYQPVRRARCVPPKSSLEWDTRALEKLRTPLGQERSGGQLL